MPVTDKVRQELGLVHGGVYAALAEGLCSVGTWLVVQDQAVLPVNSAAVFYGTNVFEGLRAYWNADDGEVYCFRRCLATNPAAERRVGP